MGKAQIIDTSGNNFIVNGIYYISNNSYYFIYTKGEVCNDNHIVFYIVKILQEITNGSNGPIPTGFLIGIKINDDNEYNLVKKDIANVVKDKENNTESFRYLDLSMLNKLKIKDYRIFKLGMDTYNKIFNNNNSNINVDNMIKENEMLKSQLEDLKKKISCIKDIVN